MAYSPKKGGFLLAAPHLNLCADLFFSCHHPLVQAAVCRDAVRMNQPHLDEGFRHTIHLQRQVSQTLGVWVSDEDAVLNIVFPDIEHGMLARHVEHPLGALQLLLQLFALGNIHRHRDDCVRSILHGCQSARRMNPRNRSVPASDAIFQHRLPLMIC